MPYAMLPRGGDDDIDLEEFLPALKRRFTWVPSQFKRYLSRPLVATFLAFGIAALFLLGRSVREGDAFEGYSHLSVTYDLQLDTVRKDGIETLPSRGASIARWPNDYPMAAAYMQKNSIIRDVQDPWPEKPYIANTWLSPERFPEGLDNLPHDGTWLPDVGKEEGQKPSPGLHNPPLPRFPENPQLHAELPKVPREHLYHAKWWTPPKRGMGTPKPSRPVQAKTWPRDPARVRLTADRRAWVKRGFLHAWEGYKAHAFGHDEVSPISRRFRDSYNAWGASTVDVLDTLLIMNLSHEYNIARTHVRSLDFSMVATSAGCNGTQGPEVHLFETVIRYLGGFMSAYDLSGDKLMLDRAKELGAWLLPAFGTSSGFPIPFYKLGSNPAGSRPPPLIAAEPGSLCMELTRLSQLTGDIAFFNAAQRIMDRFRAFKTPYGTLISTMLQDDGSMWGDFTIGGMVDSYYEYLIKMTQLLGDANGFYSQMYLQAVQDMYTHLFVNVTITPDRPGLVLIGSRKKGSRLKAEQQHLSTFAGGMFALGSKLLGRKDDLATAAALTESAVWAYRSTATGLMPEIMEFYRPDQATRWQYSSTQDGTLARLRGIPLGVSRQPAPDYRGRPEAIESVFYMYRLTGDPVWQDHGWRMFTAWIDHALTSAGFANIMDVNQDPPPLGDVQESFVLAETLKYYYLLFSDPDLISLDDYVLNTEAHPFRLPGRDIQSHWQGPEVAVDEAYADPRDRHLFASGAEVQQIPTGRGTAHQQMYRAEHCRRL